LIPNPILKVLLTLTSHQVRYLLMGGQACVLYGAAEFSRDTDIVVLADPENLDRLAATLDELQAECIAVPSFQREYLLRGHAVHFRCRHPDATGCRLDVMAVLRGVAPFPELWERRTTVELESVGRVELISLPDLVQAKKTQRDKDWPMIRRLVEAHFAQNQTAPSPAQVQFWLRECRTDAILLELVRRYPGEAAEAAKHRPLLAAAGSADLQALHEALEAEERQERDADRAYWAPLRKELEELRHRKHLPRS
jgi:hypothetical protein